MIDLSQKRYNNYRHGLSHTPISESYYGAKGRCDNKSNARYKDYGGRGIEFRFNSVMELFDEIGHRPKGLTLDRIENNGHYEKGNVRWATYYVQAQNQRSKKLSKIDITLINGLWKSGVKQCVIANMFNVTGGAIHYVLWR